MTARRGDPDVLRALLERVVSRDRAAFRALYDAASPKLFAVLLRILGRAELAEDVLQDAFLSIWNRAEQYRPASATPMSWMVAIARNRAIDILRKRSEASLEDLDDAAEPKSELPDPLTLAEQSAELRALAGCLKRLEPKQRVCLLMAYYYGYTHEEIARRSGVPVGTVKSWLSRSMKRIRDCLDHDAG